MGNSGLFSCSITPQALIKICVSAVLVLDVCGQQQCHPFSCGHLRDVQHPFRRRGDPDRCGVQSYELVCDGTMATIQIDKGTYSVTQINSTDSSFWVVDSTLDLRSSCPLPRWDRFPYLRSTYSPHGRTELRTDGAAIWATFVNCSRPIRSNMYKLVTCLSASSSYIYVLTNWVDSYDISNLEPSCGYLATIPLGGRGTIAPENASYADVVKFMRIGFAVLFPLKQKHLKCFDIIFHGHQLESSGDFSGQVPSLSTENWIIAIFRTEIDFLLCVTGNRTPLFVTAVILVSSIEILVCIIVLYRIIFAPLTVLTFIAYKFWKARITIDAVEKFLQMQQALGPARYAYTDIIAITSHFRDKLGNGGYGSVYKGILLPGNIHVAVKMLEGKSNCDGEDFISEVSTIGRIHHVNIVRLVGFCSEEMRRALVYEYMPRGSLDKYIFSSERSFSWDKLNEIALGIARGMNYLHQGCDMQILHFDIKPHNILLDNNFVPKVADFGLAKLYPRNKSFLPLSALRGTIGYIAPEMISRSFGVISCKSDVYSFGMLLLEMAGGRRNANANADKSSQAYYPSWVYDQLTVQKETEGEISGADVASMHELERKLCIIGLWCIQMKSADRPTMGEVIDMLECGVEGLQIPSKPFFCDEGGIPAGDSYHFSSELSVISEEDERV